MSHSKPRAQHSGEDGEMLAILNTLKNDICKVKEDNITIMNRLAILEAPNATIKGAPAETAHTGAYLSLKMDWIPAILRLLNLIYNEVQTPDEEK